MLFECRASFAPTDAPVRLTRAKVGLGGKNGLHFLLIGFSSSREKLPIQSVDRVMLSKNKVSLLQSACVTAIVPRSGQRRSP